MLNLSRKPLALAVSGILVLGAPATLAQGMLEEVVVTARKREENLQDTPIAVSATVSEELRAELYYSW